VSVRTRSELNQQAENLETEIQQLEARIAEEKKEAAKVEEIIENSGGKLTVNSHIK
jgi:BMFP domain-containing protein YqiC